MRPAGAPARPAFARSAPARDSVVAFVWRSRSNIVNACKWGRSRQARNARPVLREGFVDISMYVALNGRSKNGAGTRPDRLVRIFRKLRLAVFWRFCRLPIGRGSLWAGIGRLVSRFEVGN